MNTKLKEQIRSFLTTLFYLFLFGGFIYICIIDVNDKSEAETILDNKFNSGQFCDDSIKLYDDCLNYYSTVDIRIITYCRDKVDLYLERCGE